MKNIQSQEDKWQDSILSYLDYIKMHLRYPWKRGMKTPLFIGITFALFSVVSFLLEMTATKTDNPFIQYFLPPSSLPVAAFSISRYLKSLKFTAINTGLTKDLNQQLIYFLLEKQLLIYEHPQCPDITQSLSCPVNINSEQREVLVFIAEENHILINRHFTENHWISMLKNRHDKTMGTAIQQYIATYKK